MIIVIILKLLGSKGLVDNKTLVYQFNGLVLKTTKWLHDWLSPSSFCSSSNEYHIFFGAKWLKVTYLLVLSDPAALRGER